MNPQSTEKKDAKLCRELCERCADACDLLGVAEAKESAPAHPPLATLCADTAAACRAAAATLERESPQHPLFCALAAQVCRRCAEACEQRGCDHELCKNCRDACVACAEECARHAVEPVK